MATKIQWALVCRQIHISEQKHPTAVDIMHRIQAIHFPCLIRDMAILGLVTDPTDIAVNIDVELLDAQGGHVAGTSFPIVQLQTGYSFFAMQLPLTPFPTPGQYTFRMKAREGGEPYDMLIDIVEQIAPADGVKAN